MAIQLGRFLVFPLFLVFHIYATSGSHRVETDHDECLVPLDPSYKTDSFNRSSFPDGFIFGAASAAYQVSMLKAVGMLMEKVSATGIPTLIQKRSIIAAMEMLQLTRTTDTRMMCNC